MAKRDEERRDEAGRPFHRRGDPYHSPLAVAAGVSTTEDFAGVELARTDASDSTAASVGAAASGQVAPRVLPIDEPERGPGDGLTVGRIVHYTLDHGANRGACRPAMVIRTWPGLGGQLVDPYPIQLAVFQDGGNDEPYEGALLVWRTSVALGTPGAAGTWHWPERA